MEGDDAVDESDWLGWICSSRSETELRHRYDMWAPSYDEHVRPVWQPIPQAGAALLARYLKDPNTPVLDAGAGTGLVGEALWAHGYRRLTAVDLSEGMLKEASAKGVYCELVAANLEDPSLFHGQQRFKAIVSIGVFASAHASGETLKSLVGMLDVDGYLVMSARGEYRAKLRAAIDTLPLVLVERTTHAVYGDQEIDIDIYRLHSAAT